MTVQPISGQTAQQHPDASGLVRACVEEAWAIARRQLDEDQAGLVCSVVALRVAEVQSLIGWPMGTDVRSWVGEVVEREVARLRGTVRWRDPATPRS